MDAVVLAAGRAGDDFGRTFGSEHKCLIEVAGRPMIQWVLDAIRTSARIERIVVVGPEQELRAAGVSEETIANEVDSYANSVSAGLRAARGDRVLLVAADIPLLRTETLDRHLADCLQVASEVCFPIVSWERMQSQLPGARKTWYDLRDGRFTKGNAAVVRREALLSRLDRVEALFTNRKQKRWAGLICGGFLARLVGRALARAEVEAGLSHFLGFRLRAVESSPELAVDVDEVTDVAFVSGVLSERTTRDGRGTRALQPLWRAVAAAREAA